MGASRRAGLEESYRVYVTDAIRAIGKGMYPKSRWWDTVHAEEQEETDAEAIVDEVIASGGLEVVG